LKKQVITWSLDLFEAVCAHFSYASAFDPAWRSPVVEPCRIASKFNRPIQLSYKMRWCMNEVITLY
jgi:hypothetical protein